MTVKKATKTPNVIATLYEGAFDITFDCVGVEVCRHALCSFMPPDGSEECTFRDHGSCRRIVAQLASLEMLRDKITKGLKRLKDEEPT